MTDTVDWTAPVGELSMQWAQEIAQQIPGEYAVHIKPYTPLELPADRFGALVGYIEQRPDHTTNARILTHVQVCVQDWDGQRELSVQVYSPTGRGTGGVSMRWRTNAADGSEALADFLRQAGEWAWEKRLDVLAQLDS